MIFGFITLFVGVLLAAAVVLYVAYPHRGHELPVAPAVGEAVHRGVQSLPVLEEPQRR